MSDAPVLACVAVGANLGDPVATVQQALRDLGSLPQSQQVRVSSLYRSAPYEAQGPDFINAVTLLSTRLSPLALLHALQELEQQSGRERPYKNAPRTLDLDVIFYGDMVMASVELTLPHPRWHERAFVLHPLAEIWPQRVSVSQLTAVEGQVIQRMPI
jgi:2-amino-4-hydroxy-6-hydroxymethyldihydropteridine diphosphokinase